MTVWLLFTSGRGPAECRLAVAGIVRKVARAAADRSLRVTVLDDQPDGDGGSASCLVEIEGGDAAGFAGAWLGTLQWICPSPLRRTGRKNWFIGVSRVTPPGDPGGLDPADVRFETLKAGGKGGQHVNKTESAVRAVHVPSGIATVARDERSQHANKRLALARLAGQIAQAAEHEQASAVKAAWRSHDRLERGNPTRVFRGPQFEEQ